MDDEFKTLLGKVANTIRQLAMDAVQKANSGHPGLPMGCAELGAYLWGHLMHYNPKDPEWANRDRFVLSAGHGCMLQYACLHLAGYDLSLEDLKHFRQLHSKTPGHPEFGDTPGIEVSTGPLGQGVGNGVGLALGYKYLAQKFNTERHKLFDNKIYVLAGDGCIMEGISSEASSLAGHLDLNNLVLIYDSNHICLDGPLSETCSEDTKQRYKSYGWDVFEIDGHDFDALHQTFSALKKDQERPTLVMIHTVIGKGSPNKAGTHKVHGAPLGEEEVRLSKQALGLDPDEYFYIPQAVKNFFSQKLPEDENLQRAWKELFEEWSRANPELRKEYDCMHSKHLPEDLEQQLCDIDIPSPIAGRAASQTVIQKVAELLPQFIGGSADLSCSDLTVLKDYPLIAPHTFGGRNIKFGVREFGMATAASGLARTGFLTPMIGTFLTFSDYMRNAIRLACLMRVQVIYQFTHDSIFLGEDGPTHQPIEHYMSLRAIPRLWVMRPGDANEVRMAWMAALRHQGPTAILLSRQKLPEVPGTDRPFAEGVGRGAYILKKESGAPDYTLIATGSELSLAHDVSVELEKLGKVVRIVSMPCWELFEQQPEEYKQKVLSGDLGKRVSIEAGVEGAWRRFIGLDGIAISVDDFGASASMGAIAKEYGFTVDAILYQIL